MGYLILKKIINEKDKERKTELRVFDNIDATKVVLANEKFYVNREEGFIGTSLKKDEYVFDCSDIDDIITFQKDGTMKVVKVEAKTFIGKNIVHVGVFKKGDKRTVYNDNALLNRYVREIPITHRSFFSLVLAHVPLKMPLPFSLYELKISFEYIPKVAFPFKNFF